ncbi:MAG: A/G-specific adenine glycosylase, partial [Planctomycetia bacterium]
MATGRVVARPPAVVDATAVARGLVAWYRRARRDLPWRASADPYRVWVSEVMLQQTQVERVKEFFVRFVNRFPTVADLAEADERDVLGLWEGLGYYRRARQLHAAARRVVAEHGGRFPRKAAELRGLPGIGRYTAAAIASIAFDEP